jgi:hypothetical protein
VDPPSARYGKRIEFHVEMPFIPFHSTLVPSHTAKATGIMLFASTWSIGMVPFDRLTGMGDRSADR